MKVYHVILDWGYEGREVQYVLDNKEEAEKAARCARMGYSARVEVEEVEALSVFPEKEIDCLLAEVDPEDRDRILNGE